MKGRFDGMNSAAAKLQPSQFILGALDRCDCTNRTDKVKGYK